MSTLTHSNRKPRRRGRIAALVVAGVLAIAGVVATVAATSGAWLSDSGQGNVEVTTASVKMTLGDDHGSSDSFNLQFANLAPGGPAVTQTIYVRNDGSVPAKPSITGVTNFDLGGIPAAELSKLTVKINNATVTTSPVALTDAAVNPGAPDTLNPGQTGTYVVSLTLDGSAGNAWNGKTLTATGVVVDLNQAH